MVVRDGHIMLLNQKEARRGVEESGRLAAGLPDGLRKGLAICKMGAQSPLAPFSLLKINTQMQSTSRASEEPKQSP